MANENGVRSDNIDPGNLLTEFIGNSNGGTIRAPVEAVATQLLSTNPFKILTNSARLYATYDALVASGDAAVTPWVFADPDAAKNGIYRQVAGVWTWSLPLPYSFITATAGGGTPSAILAVTGIPTSEDALIILQIAETNDASPVTVSFNGGPALTVKSNSGNDIVVGGLVAGMQVMGVIAGATFRIVTDQVSAAVLAQAEAAAGTAVSAKTAAVAAMGLADRFANAPEDEEVTPDSGLFSAFHWMRKALTLGTGTALGTAAFLDVGTAAGTVAAGDDPRFAQGNSIGTIITVYGDGTTPPPGCLLANGAAVTAAYPALRAFGLANGWPVNGDGDPLLPNSGGYVERGWLPGQLVDSGRVFGTTQDDQMQRITGDIEIRGSTSGAPTIYTGEGALAVEENTGVTAAGVTLGTTQPGDKLKFDSAASPGARTGDETRMHNYTVTKWVKAYDAALTDTAGVDLAELTNDINDIAVDVAGLPFHKSYESAEQTITAAGLLTLAHGLGAAPKLLQFYLVCKTGENGYSVGDVVRIDNPDLTGSSSTARGLSARVDASNITIRFASQSTSLTLISAASGDGTATTNANWRLIVRAWA